MPTVLRRLGQMGLKLCTRRSAGQYAGAVRSGDPVFVSGAGPAGLCALNCLSAPQETLGGLDRGSRIVKVLSFLNSGPGFRRQRVVVDGHRPSCYRCSVIEAPAPVAL